MKTKRAHLTQQRIDAALRQALSLVCQQAIADQQQIALELSAAVCSRVVKVAGLPQFVSYVREEPAVALGNILRSPWQVDVWNGALVMLQSGKQLRGRC